MANQKTRYAPETCNLCTGKGKYLPQGKILTQEICPGCSGQGSVLVAQPARKCALCTGSGLYLPKGSIVTKKVCTACKGSGWAHSK